jgi:hypothetical protein
MRILIKSLMLMAMLFVLSQTVSYSQYIEIGNGNTPGTFPAYYGPWGNHWENCRTQTLYLASELGAPDGKIFTSIAWNFQQVSPEPDYLNNVTIRIKETAEASLTAGAYADMTDALQVFYAPVLVPATSTGWSSIEITDYEWSGDNNLIIEVCWGDNGYHISPFYQTFKTDGFSATRMLIGYSDAVTPPAYCAASTFYDNLRLYWAPLNPPSCIRGFVFDYDGISLPGATVAVLDGPSTTSGSDGYYFLECMNSGEMTIGCGKAGYNPVSTSVETYPGDTVTHSFILTQPNMVINPLYIEETLNPGEYYTTFLNILNNGNGNLFWQANINYFSQPVYGNSYYHPSGVVYDTSNWLTMGYYGDTVLSFGGVANVPTHLDASGTNPGEIFTAEIVFTSYPNVGTITVPVTMTILGNELIAPENLEVSLIEDLEGKASLTWDWNGDSFQFFTIRRDGAVIATTTSQEYTDILPDYGYYCYTVQAVYDEGPTLPAGPACVEWPDPILQIDPDNLETWVWTDFTENVYSTITNLGTGTLNYTFPEFAALDLLNNPDHPINLGAGGPDNFGYVWIDSDEPGGPEFIYTEISTTGSPIYGLSDDNVVGPYNIGFDFRYYGENKTRFWINSNGAIGFTSTKITLQNTRIPTNSSTYKDFIAWFWDDLYFRTGTSQAFYQTFSDRTIIQFKNYERVYHPGSYIDAEVIMYVNGRIKILYNDFDVDVELDSCTVGIQSSTPNQGLQVVYNHAYLHNDLAILFGIPYDFITDVEPAYGNVNEGGSQTVTITYNSTGYTPGIYSEDLVLESNDPENAEFIIGNTMHVYTPAQFGGTIKDHDGGTPLAGVRVTAGDYQAVTGENGEYSLFVDQGSYDVIFEKLGYITVNESDTLALQGVVTPINISLWDMNYAPGFVHASVPENDSLCTLTWNLPNGPYEILMDDGEADDYFIFAQPGSWSAVKFTPSGYPAKAIGGQVFVGDGNFPGPFMGSEFGIALFDDDGPNGLPGTMLDSSGVTVNNYGWVTFDWLDASFEDGSFYLAVYQAGDGQNAAPVGVDLDDPTYFKSYNKFLSNEWMLSPLQDFMIRAWVNGPENEGASFITGKVLKVVPRVPAGWKHYAMTRSGTMPETHAGSESHKQNFKGIDGMGNRDVTNYVVGRYSHFIPDGTPAAGNMVELANTGNLFYNDYAWIGLSQGWYAYGVKAMYTSGLYSNYTISNIVGHLMDYPVTVNVILTTGLVPENVEVELKGSEYPYETFFVSTTENGIAEFNHVWKGHYDISAFKIGYDVYTIENTNINGAKEFNIILSEKKYPPKNLKVDLLSMKATWDQPLHTALNEDFEDPLFPPPGWRNGCQGYTGHWQRTDDGSNPNWVVPPWDSYYACSNGTTSGSDDDACCDYLITPPLDLRESEGYAMYLDSYYDGSFGQLAFIEYSYDAGATWEVLFQLSPSLNWEQLELDLTTFSGLSGTAPIWFAFHADDGGAWASGWAVDNVKVQVPAPPAGYIDYWVFLDDALTGVSNVPNWDYAPLWYGQTYTASVGAHYSSGLSAKAYYTFTSQFLFPPRNLAGSAPDNAAILEWDPPLESWFSQNRTEERNPAKDLPENLLGYNVYRDGVFIEYQDHLGVMQQQSFVDEDLDPGIYEYSVTGVYDLEPYGFEGETGESMNEGPAEVVVDYCYELEFLETWSMGIENNEWISEGLNWRVNSHAGNPAPAVEFNWDPVQTDYTVALESYPLCAFGITEGNISLDFDLALGVIQSTGQEKLLVEVWNWETRVWITVAEYNNKEGNLEWTAEHVDISAQAINKVFKIRFVATGVNSVNIRSWFIDNIHVYRTCPGPKEVTAEPELGEGIKLSWQLAKNGDLTGGSGGDTGTRELTGFNIFQSVNGEPYELLAGMQTGNQYIIPEDILLPGTFCCYKVNAVWTSGTDRCESDYSDEACIFWTTVPEHPAQDNSSINIYPNPAIDRAFINASDGLKHITLINPTGQIIFDQSIGGTQFELNTSIYPDGIYMVRVETSGAISTSKLTVRR